MLAAPKLPRPHQALSLLAIAALALALGLWARFHFASLRVDADPISRPDLVAAQEQAQPLLDALEKYRAEYGLYPASLNQLLPAYVASLQTLSAFRYSARYSDWVFQSNACLEQEKALRGSILQEANHGQRRTSQLKFECISGYRDYQLQSPNFPPFEESRYLERWAYYDSQPQYWTLGWCEQVVTSKGTPRELATNGVCRTGQTAAINTVAGH